MHVDPFYKRIDPLYSYIDPFSITTCSTKFIAKDSQKIMGNLGFFYVLELCEFFSFYKHIQFFYKGIGTKYMP